jgi:uncharacterized protein YkwD
VSISAARFRYILVAGSAAVVIGAGLTGVGLHQHANTSASVGGAKAIDYAGAAAGQPAAAGGQITYPLGDPTAATSVPGAPSAGATTPAPARTKPASRPAPTPKRTKTTSTPTTAVARPPVTSGSILDQVLAHINAARTQARLPAYALNTNLSKASALHNQLMIGGCGLSHQCAGEGGIGERFSAQGVGWTSAGENIGYGSAGASDAEIIKAANGLTDSMLAEVAPNDGHRKNLLSSGFKHIGLSVTRDSKGLVWMTQDFVN